MPKTIISPSERWAGEVVLKDPIPLPDCIILEKSIQAAQAIEGGTQSEYNLAILPGILACVQEWRLKDIANPPDQFPGSPRAESAKLIAWLTGEVMKVYAGEAVPLA